MEYKEHWKLIVYSTYRYRILFRVVDISLQQYCCVIVTLFSHINRKPKAHPHKRCFHTFDIHLMAWNCTYMHLTSSHWIIIGIIHSCLLHNDSTFKLHDFFLKPGSCVKMLKIYYSETVLNIGKNEIWEQWQIMNVLVSTKSKLKYLLPVRFRRREISNGC